MNYDNDGSPEPVDRRERRFRETRDEILREARRLVEEQGAHNLSLRDVAKNMGFTPPALYRYFPRGKEEVLESLAASSVQLLSEHFDRVPRDLSPTDRLLELAMVYLEFAREHRRELDIMLDSVGAMQIADLDDDGFLDESGMFSNLREALRVAAEAGVLKASNEEELMLIFHGAWSLLHGMAVLESMHPHHEALFKMHARSIVRACLSGFAGDWLDAVGGAVGKKHPRNEEKK